MHALPMTELPYDPNQVTPGVLGFAATALVAIVVMLLMWDFNRRVRRINDRADAQERLQAEVAAAERAPESATTPATTPGTTGSANVQGPDVDRDAPQEPRA